MSGGPDVRQPGETNILRWKNRHKSLFYKKNWLTRRHKASVPLANAIAYSLPIRIPNLSNHVLHVEEFLRLSQIRFSNEIGESRTFLDLSDLEKKNLLNALLKYAIVEAGIDSKVSKQLVANIYILKDFNEKHRISDAREMSGLLNEFK